MRKSGNRKVDTVCNSMLRLFCILCITAAFLSASADDTFTVGGLTYYKNSPKTVTVVPGKVDFRGRSTYHGDVVVPAYVTHRGRKYKVTTIGEGAFLCKSLSSLTISEGITEIEKFAICVDNLGYLSIPGSVKTVPYCYAENITKLNIAEGVEVLSELDMRGPAEIIIPASVRQINACFGRHTFDEDLRRRIPRQKVTFMGKPGKINLSFTTTGIENVSVAADTIAGSFRDCPFLSKVSVEAGTEVIDSSFSRCDELSEISLPESLKSINESFSYLPRLESIAIPNSVTGITQSFRDTDNLHYLSLGTGWTQLNKSPHIISDDVKAIFMPWATPPAFSANLWYGVRSVTIYVPEKYLDKYEEAKKELRYGNVFSALKFKGVGDDFVFPPVE